jgi:uncharacterized protein (UPF0303 family)
MDTSSHDLERIAEQERRLRLPRFDLAAAWSLGCRLRDLAQQRGAALAIEVRIARQTAFFCAMPGSTPANADWARRKLNTVELTQRSSYAIGRVPPQDGQTTVQRMGLPGRDYAVAGGGFPLCVDGIGCIGAVAVSGLPQRDDHELVVEALAGICGVPYADVRLDPPEKT